MAYGPTKNPAIPAGNRERSVRFFCQQPGDGGTPLILVHGDEANRLIAGHLPPEIPFFTFHHCRPGRKPARHVSIEGIAARYVNKMVQALPHGPYLLSGYSIGGVIAFEMARLLQARGETVAALVLLDSRSPTLHADREYHNRQFRWNESRLGRFFRKACKKSVVEVCLALQLPIPPSQRDFFLMERYRRARRRYRPAPWPGNMILIRSSRENFADRELGWSKHVTGSIRVYDVETDHHHITTEPAVAEVARIFRTIYMAVT